MVFSKRKKRRGDKEAVVLKEIYKEKVPQLSPPHSFSFLKIFFLSLLFGFLGGGFIFFLGKTYFSSLSIFKELEINRFPGQEIVIEKPQKVIVEENLHFNDLISHTANSVLAIFELRDENLGVLEKTYLPQNSLGLGVILTSDGWGVTTSEVIKNLEKTYLFIDQNNQHYFSQDFFLDKATGIVFFKIKAEGLPVLKFSSKEKVTPGEKVFLVSPFKENFISTLASLKFPLISKTLDLIFSSEKFPYFYKLNETPPRIFQGGGVINLSEELVGILKGNEENLFVIPIDYLIPAFNSLLKEGKIIRPYLGLHYLDLSLSFGLDPSLTKNQKNGALIWGNNQFLPILKNSPAQKAGLEKGDIILKIEGETINSKSLSEIIQEFLPGKKIILTILRDKERKEVEVELGSQP